MCGFVIISNPNENQNSDLIKLKKKFKHRGPDEQTLLFDNQFSALFRKLNITDSTSLSSQPFTNENKTIKLIFNGEIYNYKELKKDLHNYGVKFKSKSDTEVILKLYEKIGLRFLNKIIGQFSIVILDKNKKKIFFARDHLGQKPLYFCKQNESIFISSEIKDIKFLVKKNLSFNEKSIVNFITHGISPIDGNTFFEKIRLLEPGHLGIIESGKLKIKKYWKLNITQKKKLDISKLNYYLKKAFTKCLFHSENKKGFLLSGGMDSQSIVNFYISRGNFLNEQFETYSCSNIFKNDKNNYEFKEIKNFLDQKKIKNHRFVNFNIKRSDNILEKVIDAVEDPILDVGHVMQWLLRTEIKKDDIRVLFTGEGSDEIFGGYTRMIIPYLRSVYLNKRTKIPKEELEIFSKVLNTDKKLLLENLNFLPKIYREKGDFENTNHHKLIKKDYFYLSEKYKNYSNKNPKDKNYFKKFLFDHITRHDLPYTLQMEDKVSMSQSIESRTPFLDKNLIEYIFNLDEKYFIQNGKTKNLLRTFYKKKNYKKVPRPSNVENFLLIYKDTLLDYLNSTNSEMNNFVEKKLILKDISKNFINLNQKFYFRLLSIMLFFEKEKNLGL